MQDLSFIEQNVISPYNEMIAYETLWAIEGIKEKNLKKFFNDYTPSETLEQIPSQSDFFLSRETSDETKKKVSEFLKNSLANKLNTFSIVVNKNFQYPDKLD